MAGLAAYYGRAKSSFGSINPHDMTQLGEDWLIVAGTGAGIGLLSGALGGLDKTVAGFQVPVDGLVSVGLGIAGLQVSGEAGKAMKIASIAAGGSAAVRTFEKFFGKAFATKVKGDFEDFGQSSSFGALPGYGGPYGPTVAFGQSYRDRLTEAAKYL